MESSTGTSITGRIFTDSTDGSSIGEADFPKQYNVLARKLGLPPLEAFRLTEQVEQEVSDGSLEPAGGSSGKGRSLLQRVFRRSSGGDSKGGKENRKALDSFQYGSQASFRHKSLLEMLRLGGASIITLPIPYNPAEELALPTSICACAKYLVQHGTSAPGIFRVSGWQNTVAALYDFYTQPESWVRSTSEIQTTISSSNLPSHIDFSVHDIASLFKKLLYNLPGGILGSTQLFLILRDIRSCGDKGVGVKMIALAIASVQEQSRIAIICAVFGILSMTGYATQKASKHEKPKELMTSDSLGIIFGPLLLGDLLESSDLDINRSVVHLQSPPDSPGSRTSWRPVKMTRASIQGKGAPQSKVLERAAIAIDISKMVISLWRDVVKQLRHMNAVKDGQAQLLNLSSMMSQESLQPSREVPRPILKKSSLFFRKKVVDVKHVQAASSENLIERRTFPANGHPDPLRTHPPLSFASPMKARPDPSVFVLLPPTPAEIEEAEKAAKTRLVSEERRGILKYESESSQPSSIEPTPKSALLRHLSYSEDEHAGLLPQQGQHRPQSETDTKARRRRGGFWESPTDMQRLYDNSTEFRSSWAVAEDLTNLHRVDDIQKQRAAAKHAQESDESGINREIQDPKVNGQSCSSNGISEKSMRAEPQRVAPPPPPPSSRSLMTLPPWAAGIPPSVSQMAESASEANHLDQVFEVSSETQQEENDLKPEDLADFKPPVSKSETKSTSAKKHTLSRIPVPSAYKAATTDTPVKKSELDQVETEQDPAKTSAHHSRHSSTQKSNDLDGQSVGSMKPQDSSPSKSTKRSSLPSSKRLTMNKAGHKRQASASKDKPIDIVQDVAAEAPVIAEQAPRRNRSSAPVQTPLSRHLTLISPNESTTPRGEDNLPSSPRPHAQLFTEIQRLKRQLDAKTEEVTKSKQELEAMREFKDATTLSEQLREAQKQIQEWKGRAERAERAALKQRQEGSEATAEEDPRGGKLRNGAD